MGTPETPPLFGRNEDRQIAVMVQKRQRTSGYGPTGTLTTHTEKKSGKTTQKFQKMQKIATKMQQNTKIQMLLDGNNCANYFTNTKPDSITLKTKHRTL